MSSPSPDTANPRSVVLTGIAFMVVGASLFPVMNAVAKSLASEFVLWQVTWARFIGHLVLMSLVLCPRHGMRVFASARPGLQLVRSTVFFGSNVFFIAALPWVSLASASSIMFTTPMIVTALSVIVLGEKVGPWRWGAVAMGFVGALIIVQPGAAGFEPATMLVLAAAVCYSAYQLLTRHLAAYDSAQTQILWTAIVGTVVSSLIVPFFGRMPDSAGQVLSFIALGSIGSFAHLLVIQALRRAPASVMAPIGYVELIGAAILGYLIFDNLPAITTWLGAALIVCSGLVIVWREGARKRGQAGQAGSTGASVALMAAGGLLVALAVATYLQG